MDTLGETLRKLREEKQLPLRIVASYLDIDQAILSKVERGHRKLNRDQLVKLAQYFQVKEETLLVSWLSDKLVYELEDEDLALKALQLAEDHLAYMAFKKIDRNEIKKQLIAGISKFEKIRKAWIYGSFSREDDGPKSDIDIAIEASDDFSYFDLADVQYQLEKLVNRKVDVGFMDKFRPHILENVKPDLKLIYEEG
ncbi:MAG: nucleotidyltransferase domain-containing protein [Bacteroidota bacterium]|nr:nucleotidyltransferase domain-containing protein [Bacteroidota bacterium]